MAEEEIGTIERDRERRKRRRRDFAEADGLIGDDRYSSPERDRRERERERVVLGKSFKARIRSLTVVVPLY